MWPFTSSPSLAAPAPSADASSATQGTTKAVMDTYTSASSAPSSSYPAAASADKCPVDHSTRQAWLDASGSSSAPHPFHPSTDSSASGSGSGVGTKSSGSAGISLSQHRVVSSIPRGSAPNAAQAPFMTESEHAQPDASSSVNTNANPNAAASGSGSGASTSTSNSNPNPSSGSTPTSGLAYKDDLGNWVYPSEQQFFNAMMRKHHSPRAEDMRTVVPIHNAVNERAWEQILLWESRVEGSERCGGPRLVSFVGKPKERTPKAWLKTAFGYTPPFDRHDWLVDRCGTQVRYVIDFYTGRAGQGGEAGKMSFYLDVRPAVDNWEGIKTRAASWWS